MIRDTLPRTGLLFAHKTQRTHPGGEGDGGGRAQTARQVHHASGTHTASPQAPPSRPYRGEASYTRPDVAYAVGYLCRAMAKPTPELQACAERVLMYLGRTRELGLRFERSDTRLHADVR